MTGDVAVDGMHRDMRIIALFSRGDVVLGENDSGGHRVFVLLDVLRYLLR